MFDIKTLLILIPALPLAASLATAALGARVLRRRSHMPIVMALVLSFVASVALVFQIQQEIDEQSGASQRGGYEQVVKLWTWVDFLSPASGRGAGGEGGKQVGDSSFFLHSSNPQSLIPNPSASIDITLRADPLTAAMLAIVTCISSLVAVYSIGYMQGDRGYWRFFTYVGFFVFAMTMLVEANNFAMLFVFWELVGLCSYLLIGFWYERPSAAAAGRKAFLVNRIGDGGFLLGLFLIWTTFGTLDFTQTFAAAGRSAGGWTTTAICLLLMFGACGKSAQFPLHVWLPDAMEGPTPVSALIHAATMVTAGVYMVARCMPLFVLSADALRTVALIGGATALLGGIIAVTQTDLKRILAYSTVSHLGYMFLALGTGTLVGATAGMFHLLTHAFFKALLFLAAGSVMHAMGGVIDIHRLGGLRRRMPITHVTFLIGCLAIAGVAPLAGFWSKDSILLAVHEKAGHGLAAEMYETLFATAAFGILLIDFYIFRPFFLVFYGPERIPPEAGHHAHESSGTMTGPLIVLAFGASTIGAYFEWTHGFARFLAATPSWACLETAAATTSSADHVRIGWMSTVFTLVGIALAAALYLGDRSKAARVARLMNVFGLYTISYGKFFIDAIYSAVIVRPLEGIARASAWFDTHLVDGLADMVGGVPKTLGAAMRPIQNGLVQFYALAMTLALLTMLAALLI